MMYYILFIIFFVVGYLGIISIDKTVSRFYLIFIAIMLILFAAFRGQGVDKDYENYTYLYESSTDLNVLLTEPTFIFIANTVKNNLNNVIGVFFAYCLVAIFIKFIAIRQLSEFVLLSITIYMSTFFLLHEMTQIRAGVATGFLLLCIKPIYEKNGKLFILFAIMATLFHYSSIIIFPLYFLSTSKINIKLYFGFIVLAYLLNYLNLHLTSIIEKLPFANLQFKLEENKAIMILNKDKVNVFNVLQIFRLVLCSLFLLNTNAFKERNKYSVILLKMYVFSLCGMVILSDVPTFAVRVSEFLGVVEIVLLPFITYLINPPKIAALCVFLIAVFFLCTNLFYTKLIVFK